MLRPRPFSMMKRPRHKWATSGRRSSSRVQVALARWQWIKFEERRGMEVLPETDRLIGLLEHRLCLVPQVRWSPLKSQETVPAADYKGSDARSREFPHRAEDVIGP